MIELLNNLLLTDFPSGSSINYHKDKLYLIGDDANSILILTGNYQRLETISIFDFPGARIPKPKKADLETSTIVKIGDKEFLAAFGSASRENRMKAILIDLDKKEWSNEQERFLEIDYAPFIKRVMDQGIQEVNIEGCTVMGNHLLFSNRANGTKPINHLVVTSSDFWKNQKNAPIHILDVVLPVNNKIAIGISELCYVEAKDVLLLTLSSEATSNAYDDGAIGDSYIGWIDSISTKILQSNLSLNGMLNLADCNDVFKQEKIEGICVERVEGNVLTLHLASDNDQGTTRLFKVRMPIGQPASLKYPQHIHES